MKCKIIEFDGEPFKKGSFWYLKVVVDYIGKSKTITLMRRTREKFSDILVGNEINV